MNANDSDAVVEAVLNAIAAGHPEEVRLLMHPYLHWTTASGDTLRGRTVVLTFLSGERNATGPPQSVELRDGQLYRWVGTPVE